jgi:hypothetical protein
MLCANIGVGEDLVIEGPRVRDDTGDIGPDVAGICPGGRNIAVSSNRGVVEKQVAIQASRGETGKANLVPPANIDNGVGEVNTLDVVKNGLFVVAQCLNAAGHHCGIEAGNVALHTRLLGCVGERYLVEKAADDESIEVVERGKGDGFRSINIKWDNLDPTLLQIGDIGLLKR